VTEVAELTATFRVLVRGLYRTPAKGEDLAADVLALSAPALSGKHA
jgi:hypothetical protein